jgi:hypothetical protein
MEKLTDREILKLWKLEKSDISYEDFARIIRLAESIYV